VRRAAAAGCDGAAVEPGGAVGDQARRPHLHLAGRLRLLPPRYAPQFPPMVTRIPVLTSSSSELPPTMARITNSRSVQVSCSPEFWPAPARFGLSFRRRWTLVLVVFLLCPAIGLIVVVCVCVKCECLCASPQLANLRGFPSVPSPFHLQNFPAKTMPILMPSPYLLLRFLFTSVWWQ